MLQVHELRRVFDSALKEKDGQLIFEVLERLDFFEMYDEYIVWGKEAAPVLKEIQEAYHDEYLTFCYGH